MSIKPGRLWGTRAGGTGNRFAVRRVVVASGLLLGWLVGGVGFGQETPGQGPVPTLRLSTRVVAVATVVKDKAGRPVGGLSREDFTLKEDGVPQEIRYFSQGNDLPLTLTLMVDTSGSQRMFIADETSASMIFFREMLTRPEDRAALVQFDTRVVELQPMTASVDNLQRALDYLSYPNPSLLGGKARGGTLLFDAITTASARMLGKEKGRRAMVLLTDGGDNGSVATLDQAVAAAQRSDIGVYSVFYSAGSGGASGRPMLVTSAGRAALEKLSSATGGRVYDVNRTLTLREIFQQIAEDLRLQYQIGYRQPDSAPGSYHRIELKARDSRLVLQARKGYYSPQ